jgi:hypothetical protein
MKMKKRLLSILLSLALVLGLAPGMSLTAYADNPYTGAAKIVCTGTSTITNSGGHTPVNRNATLRYSSLPVECTLKDLTGGFNFANINSSSISQGTNLTIDNTKMTGTISDLGSSSFTLTTTGGNGFNYRFDMNLTVTALETYSVTLHTNDGTISEGKNVTSYVQEMGATLPTSTDITKDGNEFKGWFDNSGLTGNAVTSISTTDTGNKEYWAKWELAHTHSFTYTASGATITATCTAAGCNLPESSAGAGDHVATLTISANGGTYDGTTAYGATITDANSIQGDAKVQYQKMTDGSYGTATETAPKDAGDYKASITVGGATASVEYTIAQADPTANAPTGLTATYGQTLANVSLEGKNPEGNTPGTWAWADSTKSVGNVVTPAATFKAIFTPDSSNYKTVENVDVTVTVGKAANPATVTGTATVIKGGNTIDLKDNVTKNGATGNVGYAIDGEANGCTLNGSVLTSGDTTGTVTVNVTVATDSNYEALAATPITVTISDKGTQTITASDVTSTYGDTDKKVNASVTNPATGGGAISYAVKEGSGDYIEVDASTGALTIKKVPADGKAYVTVTAAGTATYEQATKDVTVTINKADPTVTAPTAKTLIYTGSAQELVNAGSTNDGELRYAVTTENTAPTDDNLYTTSIPAKTEAGTYYVWYKAVGDDSHNDSVPACVKSTIEDIKTAVEQKENTPKAEVEGLDEELASDLMNDEEEKKVQSGENATLTLEMTNIDSSVSQDDQALTEKTLGSSSKNGKVGMYLDLSLWLKIGSDYARQISETGGKKITVNFEVPENLRAPAGVTRKFFMFHIHNGAINKLAETTDIKIPVTVGEFSTFVLAYEDDSAIDEVSGFYSGLKISQKNGKIKVSWDKGEGAAKYGVFVSYCGKDYSKKPVKTTKSTSVTIKKINSKKIDFTKNFKIYVAAYDSSGKQIGNTVSAHFAGKNNKKFKNAKTLKLSTKTLTLSIGKTAKIKASVKMEEGKKKELSDSHAAKFRYRSTNKNVATVDKNGKIKGVAAGTCDIYVYSRNGLAKKCRVTVK